MREGERVPGGVASPAEVRAMVGRYVDELKAVGACVADPADVVCEPDPVLPRAGG